MERFTSSYYWEITSASSANYPFTWLVHLLLGSTESSSNIGEQTNDADNGGTAVAASPTLNGFNSVGKSNGANSTGTSNGMNNIGDRNGMNSAGSNNGNNNVGHGNGSNNGIGNN